MSSGGGGALRARGIGYAYGAERVLDGVDFTLDEGRLSVVVGPNGSGKTTLVRVLCGLLVPPEGAVELRGEPIRELGRRAVARELAVVPQEIGSPFPYRVRELVAMGRAPHLGAFGREGPADRAAVDRALAELELGALAERSFLTLSGGEKQRVGLARAIAQDAPILLLDEPTAHMDLGRRLRTFEWLLNWVGAAPGRGVGLITHDLVLAARFADSLLLLDQGRVAGSGAPEEVLTPARIRDVYALEARVTREEGGGLAISPLRSTPRPS